MRVIAYTPNRKSSSSAFGSHTETPSLSTSGPGATPTARKSSESKRGAIEASGGSNVGLGQRDCRGHLGCLNAASCRATVGNTSGECGVVRCQWNHVGVSEGAGSSTATDAH